MAKENVSQKALNEGNDVDLTTQAQVENVAEQGSPGTPLPEETVSRNEKAHNVTHDDLATATTTESDYAVQGDENTSAEQESQAKAEKFKLVSIEDQQARDKLKDYLSAKGVEAKVILKYDLKKLMAAAIILVAYAANRKVDEKHVNKLLQSLKKSDKKRFSEPITVCLAKIALMLGAKLRDDDGNEITLSHPDIDRMFVVLDGQHRLAAVKGSDFEYEADVVIIEVPEDIDDYVRVINAHDSNWTMDDIRNQNEVISGVEDKLKAKEQEAEKILPKTSLKYRAYGLTGEKEAVKKKELLEGKVPVCDEDKANRGMEIFKATRILNPDCDKNGLLTMSWLTEVFKAKDEYNKTKGDVDFIKHLKLFMNEEHNKGLDPTKKDKVSAFIQDFTKNFKAFVRKNPLTPDADEQIKLIDAQIQSIIDAGVASTGKVYARGSMSDVVAKMKERKKNQAKLDKAKAEMDKAIDAAKKAYQDFKNTL